ncbi:MAG TPA: class I SAM-dependent methyltransferase [Acidimicrobiales bacterium]|nr:class I SAM-dependent methyltransferase [Acidimicrobiales bacterium]
MADAVFENRRLAELYDALDPVRDDLDQYLAIVDELGVQSILDLGCGTGTFACLLSQRGLEVIGVDPAAASLDVARRKSYADRVRWICGDAASLPPLQVDLVTMTGNVAQVFETDEEWSATLRAVSGALRPGGTLIFEVRDPAREGWNEWNRQQSLTRINLPNVGAVDSWVELLDVTLPLVSLRWTFAFQSDGATITSDSTLRFRERTEILSDLERTGFVVGDIRDAPDRPGREFVFIVERGE